MVAYSLGPDNGAPMGGARPRPDATQLAPQTFSFYQDNPPALGSGTYAESFPVVPSPGGILVLRRLAVRCDFPFSAGERARIRLYRYRKPAPFGPFAYTQITDLFDFDDTLDWSWTYDISDRIRNGFDLNPETDSIAVSNVYTAGGTPSVRALRVDFEYGPES